MNFIKKHRGFITWALFVAVLSFAGGVFDKHYLPKIKTWSLAKIKSLTTEMAPLIVEAKEINFDLFPIGIELKQVLLTPKEEIQETLVPTEVESVSAHLSFWSFITGRLELSRIHLHNFDLKLFFKTQETSQKPEGFDFSILSEIPVQRILITDARVWAQDRRTDISAHAPKVNFEIINRRLALLATLDAKEFMIKKTGDKAIFDSDVSFRIRVDKDNITFNRVRIRKQDSFILASGDLAWNSENLSFSKIKGKTRSLVQMRDVEYISKEFFPDIKVPALKGRIFLELSTDHTFGKSLIGNARLRTRELEIDEFKIGDVKAVGTVDEESTEFSQIDINHPGGRAKIDDLKVQLQSPYAISGKVSGSGINLNPLLDALTVEDVALYSDIRPQFDCTGQIVNPTLVTCKGSATAKYLSIFNNTSRSREVVKFENAKAQGSVVVGPQAVSYQANIELADSKAESSGTILYKGGGLLLHVKSDHLNFADVKQISELKFGGIIKGEGQIERRDRKTTADFQLSGDNFSFESWLLDELSTHFTYKDKSLHFAEISGNVLNSQYEGQIIVDIGNSHLSIDANVPQLDFSGINKIVPQKIIFPRLQSAGIGRGMFTLDGPFEIAKSNWSFNLSSGRGVVAGESFDQALISINSDSGSLGSRQCLVKKSSGQISCKVNGTLDGSAEINITGQQLSLEQSETVQKYIENLSGYANFQLSISNLTEDIDIKSSGQLRSLQLADLPIPNVFFEFNRDKEDLSGEFHLGENIIDTKFKSNLVDSYSLSGSFNNWDFSRFFSAFSDSLRVNTYEANLRGSFDVRGNLKDLNRVNGSFDIDNLSVRSNNIKIENAQPMKLVLREGRVEPQNIYLDGMDNYIRVKKSDANTPVALIAEGRLEMSLLSLLTPFFDDLKGLMNFSTDLRGSISNLKFSGNTYIQNGFVKLKDFPHPIEQYSADILFDNNKIVINSAKGKLAGGSVSGSGQISFIGYKNIPLDIRGSFVDSSFEVPAGFFTRGSGDFSVTGNWLPYTLGVSYNVAEGRVNREISNESDEPSTIRPSPLLPTVAREQSFTPIILDLDVDLPSQLPVNMLVARLDIRSEVSGNMKIKGAPTNPYLTGRIRIERGSQVIFRDNTFEVLSGYVQYNNSTPANPNLNVTAFSRVLARVGADEEREIDVTLRIFGSAQNPEVNISSQPALSERDLISLLAFGFIPTTNQGNQPANPSYQLGNVVVNELFGLNRSIRKNFGVEFDYSSGFDDETSSQTHTVTVKKQWTPKFGASVSRSFGQTNRNNVRAEYKINNKWSVIGSYQGEEQAGSSEINEENEQSSQFGVDLEYRVDFK